MKILLSKREANIPLFLSLACEELRVFGMFEKVLSLRTFASSQSIFSFLQTLHPHTDFVVLQIMDKLKSLPHTLHQLLQDILTRLEEDHGKDVVATAMSLLICSRNGAYRVSIPRLHSRLLRECWSSFLSFDTFQVCHSQSCVAC